MAVQQIIVQEQAEPLAVEGLGLWILFTLDAVLLSADHGND